MEAKSTDTANAKDVNDDDDHVAVEHAWSWFELHANQRLQMFNFWLISVAFLAAAYVTALTASHEPLACVVAVLGFALSVCFHRLERRTRGLVRIGEAALEELEERLARRTGVEEMRIVVTAHSQRGRFTSYGRVILAMQWLVIVSFAAAAIAAPILPHSSKSGRPTVTTTSSTLAKRG